MPKSHDSPIHLSSGGRILEAPLPKSMRGIAYSGDVAEDFFLDGTPVVIDLASTSLAEGVQLFYGHIPEPIGIISLVVNTGAAIVVEAASLFTEFDDTAKKIALKGTAGVKWQLSVGLYGATETKVTGQDVTINGRTFQGPLIVLSGGEIREVSIVPLGADRHTNAEFFSAQPKEKEQPQMPVPQENELAEDNAALAAKNAELSKRLAEVEAENHQLEVELAEIKLAARKQEIASLFGKIGIENTETSVKPYLAMDCDTFSAVSAHLTSVVSRDLGAASLFSEMAVAKDAKPAETKPELTLADVYSKYMKSQKGENA